MGANQAKSGVQSGDWSAAFMGSCMVLGMAVILGSVALMQTASKTES